MLVIVQLFGILCLARESLSAPTGHSHSKHEVESCFDLHALPLDLVKVISESLPAHDLASLAQTDNYTHGFCKPDLTQRKAQKLIGETPSFMPAIKRCLMYDDLSCYKLVLEHFTEKRLVQGHHLTQMPALAVQLNATKIFKSLGKDNSHPLWYHWMTRAVVRDRFRFLEDVAGILPPPLSERHFGIFPKPLEFYDRLSDSTMMSLSSSEPSNFFCLGDDWHSNYVRLYKDWIVEDMVQHQPRVWENIFDALKMDDKMQREKRLLQLKADISSLLSEGIYVIDDILLTPINIHRLWRMFVTPEGSEFDDRVEFIKWLIEEGSPISDMASILLLREVQAWVRNAYEHELQMTVKYASGSATASLVNQLRIATNQYIVLGPLNIARALPIYKDVLHANFSDPAVVKYAKMLVKKNRDDDQYRIEIEKFFMGQGHDLNEL